MSPVFRLPSCVPRPYPASRVPDSSSLPLSSARVSAPVASNAGSLARSGTLTASPCAGVELPVRGRTFGIRLSPLPLVRGGSPSRLIRATRDGYTQASGVYMSMSVSMSAPQTSTRTRTCGQWPVASTADAGAGDARPGCVSDSMLLLRAGERGCVCPWTDVRSAAASAFVSFVSPCLLPFCLPLFPLYSSFFPLSAYCLPSSRPYTLSHGPPMAHTPGPTHNIPLALGAPTYPTYPTFHIPHPKTVSLASVSFSVVGPPTYVRVRIQLVFPKSQITSILTALSPLPSPHCPLLPLHLGIRAAQLVVQRGSAPHTPLFLPAPRGVGIPVVLVLVLVLVLLLLLLL